MSVQSVVGNFTKTVQDTISNTLHNTKGAIENIIGTVNAHASSFWDGGFVGMSYEEKEAFKEHLGKYVDDVQSIIDGFDANATISMAIKGKDIEPAVHDYLNSMKQLLKAYVSTVKQEIAEIDEAYENFVGQAQRSISSDVETMSSDIKNQAEKVSLD